MESLLAYFSHPALWISVLIIGTMGEIAQNLILGPKNMRPKEGFRGWKGVYVVTYKAHAIFVGCALGMFIPGLPVAPDSLVTEGRAGSVMFYGGAGAIAMIAYAILVSTVKGAFKNYGKKLGGSESGDGSSRDSSTSVDG